VFGPLPQPGSETAAKWFSGDMTTPPDDAEMKTFVRRLFGRDDDPEGGAGVDPDTAWRNLARQLFNRDDDKG